ncbi:MULTISPECIES: hypothetical protein [unclassified Streptomyces]|uniref:hypothetical protein n=1 Tax=unclassified Streptomyces TaxID=2593676 RepID=UPI00227004E0|nr:MULTISPECIES: hypothetical protein [unclassified Streptomyces]MCY0916841.1 hypothetical protein [Streptomyces sp. H27-G5]MCY0957999.1 hypothetical protein [Streptomyces sp. H27-H5]
MHTNQRVRLVAAGAATALALTLTGCGGGGADKGDDAKREQSKSPAPASGSPAASGSPSSPAAGSTAGGTGKDSAAGSLDGAWIASATPGMGVVFTVNGKSAFLSESATGIVCEGSATGATIDLACPAGSKRTKGRVESVDAKKLKVAWAGGATETFDRYASDRFPTALPTDLPTDLPKLPPTP